MLGENETYNCIKIIYTDMQQRPIHLAITFCKKCRREKLQSLNGLKFTSDTSLAFLYL